MTAGRYPHSEVTADPDPADAPFRFAVEKRRDFSPEAPAALRIQCENRTSSAQRIGFGPVAPFSRLWSRPDGVLVLVPSDREFQRRAFGTDDRIVPDHPVDGCWQPNRVRFMVLDVLRYRSLDAGESVTTEYVILDYPEREIMEATMDEWYGPDSDRDRCLPAGEYRFEASYPPKTGTETSWDEFDWGFTVTIAE